MLVGALIAVLLPAWGLWGTAGLRWPDDGQRNAMVAAFLAYALSHRSLHVLFRYPGSRSPIHIAPYVLLTFAAAALIMLALRLDMSRALMASSCVLSMLWCYIDFRLRERYQRPKLAVVPSGSALELFGLPNVDARRLTGPTLGESRYDAVVADLDHLPGPEWERFLAHCALSRVPVYHARQMFESLTGRVRVTHMSENPMGALLPSPGYELLKYVFDVAFILATLPITLPLVLLTALAIRLESRGPVIFTQERIGQGNRPFQIYKFRSMAGASDDVARFAGENDVRITRVGAIIRKLRIDEIPQFINILKGEMSLIGPRPEQLAFVERFDREIPFYTYRHVVRPGITGWAQVTQGYVASADATRTKIELDFYYIKHCSLALDLLIVLRTIQTVLTGFGAR
ncbi:sugar transferase [Verticiella sediminum]|uniref:Sugar transferase n=2 Tax=Verticiella sediminum TaxID=1247510 RepID=A0A556ADX2_9BURK|nr:sugar transferase [Verticiella sediminum]